MRVGGNRGASNECPTNKEKKKRRVANSSGSIRVIVWWYSVAVRRMWLCVRFRYTVGLSGKRMWFDSQWGYRTSVRSSDVCVCVTEEVRAIVSTYFEILLQLKQAWLAYLKYGEWRGRLVLKRGWCVWKDVMRERTNERTNERSKHMIWEKERSNEWFWYRACSIDTTTTAICLARLP